MEQAKQSYVTKTFLTLVHMEQAKQSYVTKTFLSLVHMEPAKQSYVTETSTKYISHWKPKGCLNINNS